MKTFLSVSISVAFILFNTACNMQPKTSLNLNLQKGDKFLYESSTDAKTSTEMMGKTMDQHQLGKVSYTMQVTGKNPDSSMNMMCVLTDISMKVDGADKGSTADSNSTQAAMNRLMDAMKGITFEMTMNADGKILSVKGSDNMFDKILSSLPESMNGNKDQMKEIMKQYAGEDALKESFKSFRMYPDHPIGVGSEWKNNFKMEMLGLQMFNTYTLNALSSNNAVITCGSKMVNDSTAKPMEMMGMEMRYNLSGDQSGMMTVNTINGLLSKADLTQKISGRMEMSGGQLSTPMNFPMTMENIITVKVTKL